MALQNTTHFTNKEKKRTNMEGIITTINKSHNFFSTNVVENIKKFLCDIWKYDKGNLHYV
jgi:hypothetical protein